MVKCVRGWFAGDKSWPFLLLMVVALYLAAPRDWWATVTFILIGVFYVALAIAHALEFWLIQRKWPYLLFMVAKVCFGVALLVVALIMAPQHYYDFSGWRIASRIFWFVGLPFWALAVYSECWRIYRLLTD